MAASIRNKNNVVDVDDEAILLNLSQQIHRASLKHHSQKEDESDGCCCSSPSSSATTVRVRFLPNKTHVNPSKGNHEDLLKSPQKVRRRYKRRNSFVIDRKRSSAGGGGGLMMMAMDPSTSFHSSPCMLQTANTTKQQRRSTVGANSDTTYHASSWDGHSTTTLNNATWNTESSMESTDANTGANYTKSDTIDGVKPFLVSNNDPSSSNNNSNNNNNNSNNNRQSNPSDNMFLSPTVTFAKKNKLLHMEGLKTIQIEESPRTPSLLFKPKADVASAIMPTGQPLTGSKRVL